MAMIEAEKAATAITPDTSNGFGGGTSLTGSEGLFAALEARGLVYTDANFNGTGSTGSEGGLDDFDAILAELDKQ